MGPLHRPLVDPLRLPPLVTRGLFSRHEAVPEELPQPFLAPLTRYPLATARLRVAPLVVLEGVAALHRWQETFRTEQHAPSNAGVGALGVRVLAAPLSLVASTLHVASAWLAKPVAVRTPFLLRDSFRVAVRFVAPTERVLCLAVVKTLLPAKTLCVAWFRLRRITRVTFLPLPKLRTLHRLTAVGVILASLLLVPAHWLGCTLEPPLVNPRLPLGVLLRPTTGPFPPPRWQRFVSHPLLPLLVAGGWLA